jgi:hypothetical protein
MLYAIGWKDLFGPFSTGKVAGSNVPVWTAFRDGLYNYSFTATALKELWMSFHFNHDWAPGTPIYPHIHYSPFTDEASGVVRWGIEFSYSKGHGQDVFPASQTVYLEQTVEANSQYKHYIVETADSAALENELFEVDGIIQMRIFRDGAHVNDTYAGNVAGLFVDIHYQSDRDTTVNKAPSFYG